MNGMHYETHYAYNDGDTWYSASWHYELAATPCIVQLSLGSYDEFDDQGLADLAITHIEFKDANGHTQSKDFPIAVNWPAKQAMSVDKMTRVDWNLIVSNAFARFLVNVFMWDSVS
jgi:hypothetical protein